MLRVSDTARGVTLTLAKGSDTKNSVKKMRKSIPMGCLTGVGHHCSVIYNAQIGVKNVVLGIMEVYNTTMTTFKCNALLNTP